MDKHRQALDRFSLSRRSFLQKTVATAGMLGLGLIGGQAVRLPIVKGAQGGGADTFGPLQPADANGLMLPPGFTSRIIARGSVPIAPSNYIWGRYPDGAATFPTGTGGWILVANSERSSSNGGVGAIEFDPDGNIIDAYSILTGTTRNCAGGPTPWGTWLSCEEYNGGTVWECDPFVASQGIERLGMGTFEHEAASVDPVNEIIYLTEDENDSCLYRFIPTSYPDLSAGVLEVAEILDPLSEGPIVPGQVRPLAWHQVVNPNPLNGGVQSPTTLPIGNRAVRYQIPAATEFERGEGCWYHDGTFYFSTTRDHRVWAVDTDAQTIEIVYDEDTDPNPILRGPDNIYVSSLSDVYVAEDGGNLELVALTAGGDIKPVIRVSGGGHSGSEIAGPCLSPDGMRMYFSSQRAQVPAGDHGITYEVMGPWAPSPTGVAPVGRSTIALSSYPNPFRGRTQIQFVLPQPGRVELKVFDVRGRLVRTLIDGEMGRGDHSLTWGGRTSNGADVPAGLYLLRLTGVGDVATRAMYVRR